MRYKAVIFDLDGVLVSTDNYHYLAWKSIAEKLGIFFDGTINERLRGISRMKSLDIVLEKSDENFDNDKKVQLAEEKNNIYKKYLKNLTNEDLLDNVKDTLLKLKEMGIKIAIGSSSKNTEFILKQVGIYEMFDAISDGTNIKFSKPHPEVFMKAADKLFIEYKDCLVVEDADAGCIAAKSALMDVIGISSANNSKFADYHVDNIIEILTIVK